MRTGTWTAAVGVLAGAGLLAGCGEKSGGGGAAAPAKGAADAGTAVAKKDRWKCACGKVKEVDAGAATPSC
ncbi:MAG: hypothetical protein L0216_03280 [Planctomycetales bacterium]|nr:hypothetical protein [Planctomycetales bacterium]